MSKAEQTRQFIIEKTAPIFNTKGYAGTSLSDMTEATGLTKGSIYGNFADKDEVAVACFEYNVKKLSAAIGAEIAKRSSYRDKLMAYIDVHNGVSKGTGIIGGCPIVNTTVDADDTHEVLRGKARDAFIGLKNKLVQLIEGGKAAGEFAADINAEEKGVEMMALMQGCILIGRATGKSDIWKSVLGTIEKFINSL